MIETSLFQNTHLVWPVAGIVLALWLVFIWKEWSRPLKNRFYLNALISLITIACFAMLVIKPTSETVQDSKSGVLLTKGYSLNKLDSLKANHKGIKHIVYQENLQIDTLLDSINHLTILGDGVEPYDLWQYQNRSVSYLGGDLPHGIIDITYNQENLIGEHIRIAGKFNKVTASHRIVLEDGNSQSLDSVELNADKTQFFELSTPLKALGKFVYQLVEKDTLGDVISKEPVPFTVSDKGNIKVLLVNSFPTFETKYLKNYLAEMGHQVVVRSQITRGRYKFEYFNTKKIPIYRLGEKEVEDFDLFIIDGDSFRNLSQNSWKSIEKATQNSGLGLLVQLESNMLNLFSKRTGLDFKKAASTKTFLDGNPKIPFEKFPFQFISGNGVEEIHQSNTTIITAYKRKQQGRIGATLILNSYQLQLDGKQRAYRKFWSDIVNKLSKKSSLQTDWKSMNIFPVVNSPFQFEMRTKIENPKVLNQHKNQIALRQNIDMPNLWNGVTYPKEEGWNKLYLESEPQDAYNFYVIDSASWQSVRTKRKQLQNQRFFAESSQDTRYNVTFSIIPPLWFFILGLIGLSFLWIHPKVFPN